MRNALQRVHRSAILGLALLVLATVALGQHDSRVNLQVRSDSPELSVLTYAIDAYESGSVLIDGTPHQTLGLPGHGYHDMSSAGHPQLPALADSLLIPDDARMSVRVVSADWHDVQGLDVAPWRGPISRAVDPASVPYTFGSAYTRDAFFPAEIASLDAPYILHDRRGTVLRITPFQYNPATRTLRVYTEVEVEVVASGAGQQNVIDRVTYGQRPDRSWNWIYANQFVNWPSYAEAAPAETGDLLIIAQSQFLAAMQPLVDWKNATGIATTLVDLASIGNDASAIKAHIQGVYDTSNLAFVLLVGDYPGLTSFWYAGGLSDPTYSTLTADWYPDLFVGRFSATTVAHVDTQVQRTIEYEGANHGVGSGGWNAMALGIASSEGVGIGHYGEGDWQHMGLMRDELLGAGFSHVDEVYEPTATKAQISAALNEGRRYVNYVGHGSSSSWGTTGFSNTNVNALTNTGVLPVICSVACVNGEFNKDTCFAEAWLRATHDGQPAGAAATYMSSINQSWAPPMYGQGNHGNSGKYGANEHLCLEMCETVSGLWFGGSCTMMDVVGNAGREMFMTWHVFGDPSLRAEVTPDSSTLAASGAVIPLRFPVDIAFTVKPGPDHAGAKYFLLASASGSVPGFALPNGLAVPLNWDVLTDLSVAYPNGGLFDGFFGTLDGSGQAVAHLDTAPVVPLHGSLVGAQLTFSAIVWQPGGPYELATNPKTLVFID